MNRNAAINGASSKDQLSKREGDVEHKTAINGASSKDRLSKREGDVEHKTAINGASSKDRLSKREGEATPTDHRYYQELKSFCDTGTGRPHNYIPKIISYIRK